MPELSNTTPTPANDNRAPELGSNVVPFTRRPRPESQNQPDPAGPAAALKRPAKLAA